MIRIQDVSKLIEFHLKRKRLVTVTATKPAGRFGALKLNSEDEVLSFKEKPRGDGDWINGGFFVLSPEAINYIDDDATTWESTPLETLAQERQISAYKHGGFWYAMDTLRDNIYLEKLWKNNEAPWKTWS